MGIQEIAAESRRAEVTEMVDGIVDPCSAAAGVSLGLIEMGIATVRGVGGGVVEISISPTFPGCRFSPIFEQEIRQRARDLDWCKEVIIEYSDPMDVWTEERMSEAARARLKVHRQRVADLSEKPTGLSKG
jgi:metal-sulfur cluster biosynthetic enzyme